MAAHASILAWRIYRQRSLVGYSPYGHKELNMTEHTHMQLLIYFLSLWICLLYVFHLWNQTVFILGYLVYFSWHNVFKVTMSLFIFMFTSFFLYEGKCLVYYPLRNKSVQWCFLFLFLLGASFITWSKCLKILFVFSPSFGFGSCSFYRHLILSSIPPRSFPCSWDVCIY